MFIKKTFLIIAVILCGIISACTQKKSESKAGVKGNLLGAWQDNESNGPTFEIKKDSIYYFRKAVNYKYQIDKDSIKVFFPDYTYTARLYVLKDTLIMDSPYGGINTYKRMKN